MDTAVVLFSGGADSTVCLHWALSRCRLVKAVSFDYAQRHRIELDCAAAICARLGVERRVIPLNSFAALGGNALAEADLVIAPGADGSLPNTFVPGRNLVFLSLAAAWAWQLGIADLVTGVCETDYSGYPDCRESTIRALEQAISLGLDRPLRIHTPLMHLSKAESIHLAHSLDAFPSLALSHTCYEGRRPPCGACPSCVLRARGFAEAGFADPLTSAG